MANKPAYGSFGLKIKMIGKKTSKSNSNKYRGILAFAMISTCQGKNIQQILEFCKKFSTNHKNCINQAQLIALKENISKIEFKKSTDLKTKDINTLMSCFDANHFFPIGELHNYGLHLIMLEFMSYYGIGDIESPRIMEYTTPDFNRIIHINKIWREQIKIYITEFAQEGYNVKNFAILVSRVIKHPLYQEELKAGRIYRPNNFQEFDQRGVLPSKLLSGVQRFVRFTLDTTPVKEKLPSKYL
jgi:hypothetical protein